MNREVGELYPVPGFLQSNWEIIMQLEKITRQLFQNPYRPLVSSAVGVGRKKREFCVPLRIACPDANTRILIF